jgi:hypothetical protein
VKSVTLERSLGAGKSGIWKPGPSVSSAHSRSPARRPAHCRCPTSILSLDLSSASFLVLIPCVCVGGRGASCVLTSTSTHEVSSSPDDSGSAFLSSLVPMVTLNQDLTFQALSGFPFCRRPLGV